jgi:transcriptional regulator with XRE-family HTH domain
MRDTLRSPRQQQLRALLRDMRERQGLTQEQVAERLSKPQSFVSKYEGGERRLSVIEFIDVVRALGLEPSVAIRKLLRVIDTPVRTS